LLREGGWGSIRGWLEAAQPYAHEKATAAGRAAEVLGLFDEAA
jgi:hypothetical protein